MTSTPKTKKPKSPAVPSYSLKDSVDDVRKLYQTFSHAVFSKPEIATTLKMSSNSGPFVRRAFTLSEYGLLVESGAGHKVSDLFLTLNSGDASSAAFKRAALKAINNSAVFAEVLAEFKTKLPPQASVAQRLETQKKFNADRAKEVASVLERSLQFAGVLDSSNNILPVRDDSSAGDTSKSQELHKEEPTVVTPPVTPGAVPMANARRTEVPLTDGRIAIVQYPHDLSTAEAEKIGRVLAALVG